MEGLDPPVASWRDVSFDGRAIRGASSVTGPFEIPLTDLIAVGEHIAWDDPDTFVANLDCWSSFLTREHYGLVHESHAAFNAAVRAAMTESHGFDQTPPAGWPDWNNGTAQDSRFIYPPWLYSFPIYEWIIKREPCSWWDRLTGTAVSRWLETSYSQTVRWLLAQPDGDTEQKKRWERFIASPPRPEGLGRRRMAYHWRPSIWLRRIRTLMTSLAVIGAVLVLEQYSDVPTRLLGLLAIASPIVIAWLPQLFAATALYDEGLVTRTWFVSAKSCFYDDIATMEEGENQLRIVLRDGSSLTTTRREDQYGGFKNTIEHRRLISLSRRYAQCYGIPFRSPDLKY